MSLNNLNFLLYFAFIYVVMAVVELVFRIWKKNIFRKIQIVVLLLFSYFFIYRFDWRFTICIFLYTVFIYLFGQIIERIVSDKGKHIMLLIGSMISILMLGYFKYCNFFLAGLSVLFQTDNVMLDIILPIGISFYTFTGIAYLLDVYWKRYPAEKDFLVFALYISFFPKLTAGPIVRGKEFFPQVHDYQGLKLINSAEGIQIFLFGLFKKIVLADHLGVFVDDVFFAPTAYHTGTVVLAALSYSLQIYFDFSGYSDMAIGISKMLGFGFHKNFNLPYMAQNISDFWRRWHISLSSWFQEYLYIPLGGSRNGEVRTYVNLLLVMLISGLWHGAGWTFIIWGLLHGVFSCLYRIVDKWKRRRGFDFKILKYINIFMNFVIVTLLWVIFRAENMGKAFAVFHRMFTWHDGIVQPYSWSFFAIVCLIIATVVAVIRSGKMENDKVDGFYPVMDLTKLSSLIIFFTFAGLTVIMGYFGNNYFIYGKF